MLIGYCGEEMRRRSFFISLLLGVVCFGFFFGFEVRIFFEMVDKFYLWFLEFGGGVVVFGSFLLYLDESRC